MHLTIVTELQYITINNNDKLQPLNIIGHLVKWDNILAWKQRNILRIIIQIMHSKFYIFAYFVLSLPMIVTHEMQHRVNILTE